MIEIIAGTNRPESNAMRVAKVVLKQYKKQGVEAQILSLADMPQEIFQSTSYAEKPESFQSISQRVLDADGLHVITPEYNGSFPGVLKYFIDMLKFPESFEGKPVAFIGEAAGVWGGFRAVEQLQMVFGYRNAFILPQRLFIPKIHEKLGDNDTFSDEFLQDLLVDQCTRFPKFIAGVK
jgi:NAD(P)H-dependent FMN reductase